MNEEEVFRSSGEEETLALGRRIGCRLRAAPRTVLLFGELGAGKTILTRGIVEGLGLEDSSIVHSPSFSLIHEYPTSSGMVYHIDLYRLATLRDLYSIGIEDILGCDSVVIIEWAEKLRLPVEHPLIIRIEIGEAPGTRTFHIQEG